MIKSACIKLKKWYPLKKVSRKSWELNNIQVSKLIRKAITTLKNLSEGKPQQNQSPNTTDDAFCKTIFMLLKIMKDDSPKEFLKLDIHCLMMTAIDQNTLFFL